MKHRRAAAWSNLPTIAALLGAALLFCGCSTPSSSFTAYHGSEVFQGKGGDEDDVDGIEIWQNGEPDRKYRILGVVAEPHRGHHMGRLSGLFGGGGSDRGSAIAKIAHDHGGDAVIVVVKEQPITDSDLDYSETSHHHRQATLVIVKYVK